MNLKIPLKQTNIEINLYIDYSKRKKMSLQPNQTIEQAIEVLEKDILENKKKVSAQETLLANLKNQKVQEDANDDNIQLLKG